MNKIAVFTSHPIQYQAPLFRKMAESGDVAVTVYFYLDDRKQRFDKEFGKEFQWDIPVLAGYKNIFLKNYSPKPSSNFWGQINPGVMSKIRKNGYDAVLVFGWNSFSNWLVFLTAFLAGIPVILRGENPLNQENLKSNWKIKIKKLVLGWLFRHVRAFLSIGKENAAFYKFYGVPDKKLFFAPYAVDNDRFTTASRKLTGSCESIRLRLGMPKDAVVILFAGKLIGKKRPQDLIKAFGLLNSKSINNNSYLLFVGDGELRPALEAYVHDQKIQNVKFTGFKNQSEIPEFYSISDILVLPSGAGETWGLVVNESMCFGIVPVVSDVVGCGPDLVRSHENGFIFKFGDIEALSKILSELVLNKEKRQKFSERSAAIISAYTYDRDLEALRAVLKQL